MSLFVNPAQFGDAADLTATRATRRATSRSPREAGVDVVFAPQVEEMYPPGLPDLGRRDRARLDARGRAPARATSAASRPSA